MSAKLRIAHLGDTHLGYRALPIQDPETGRNQRSVDIERAFTATIDDILARDIDLVIHGGDVFHQSRPSWHAVRNFVAEMRRIEDAGIPAVVIAGNHDTPRYRAGGSVFSVLEVALPKIHISAGYEEEAFLFDDLDLRVQTVPHGALVNPDRPITYAIPDMRNILVTHGMTAGILDPGIITEPGEQELNSELFQASFDYIALGHYHISIRAFPSAWYSGATERMGWGDADVDPGYLVTTFDENGLAGDPEHRTIPARPMHMLEPVYADRLSPPELVNTVLDQLERFGNTSALTRVQVRNADRQVYRDVERRLRRESHDKTMHLTVTRPALSTTPDSIDVDRSTSIRDLHSLFGEFVAQRRGEHYSAEFASRFLERGGAALQEAQQRINDSDTEGSGA